MTFEHLALPLSEVYFSLGKQTIVTRQLIKVGGNEKWCSDMMKASPLMDSA